MSASTAHSRFLDLRALAAVEQMRFTTRHRIEGAYSGRHQSRQKGGAGEFVDYREYSYGEDLRRIDWKVLGRTGKAYVRLYQDETNLLCTLAIDASGSMQFGAKSTTNPQGSKLEYAQYLSTALSHVISRGQDQVGLAVLNGELGEFLGPGGRSVHVDRLQELIEQIDSQPTGNLPAQSIMAPALQSLFSRSPSRGVLLLMSDFLLDDLAETFAAIRLFRHRQSDVIILHLVHPQEERLPEGAAYRFVGLENDGSIDCSPTEIRDLYQQRFEAHAVEVRALALANGCDYRRISTTVPYMQTLGQFLVERAG